MAASNTVAMDITANYTKVTTLATFSGTPKLSYTSTLSSSDISKVFQAVVTGASPVSYDLNSVTDQFGASINFAIAKGIYVKNTGSATLVLSGNVLPASESITVKAGQLVSIPSVPLTVTNTTADTLTLTPASSTTYELLIVGS